MKATGRATWGGSWKEGFGTISTETDTFKDKPYNYSSRFEGTAGASPEELFAAALASCFNQALANNFGMIGFEAESITTSLAVEHSIQSDGRPAIVTISMLCLAKVPDISKEQFDRCAEEARTHCAIIRITTIKPDLSATLL